MGLYLSIYIQSDLRFSAFTAEFFTLGAATEGP